MKKNILIGGILVLVLMGAGCTNSEKDDEFYSGFPEQNTTYNQPNTVSDTDIPKEDNSKNTASVSEQTASLTTKSPRERGMVRIKVISSETKLPVAGVPLVVYSSMGTTTNLEGWAEFPQSTGNVYVPPVPGNWKGSGYVNTMNGDKDGMITIMLEADSISARSR